MEKELEEPTEISEENDGAAAWLWTIALLVIIAIGVLVFAVHQPQPGQPATRTTQPTP